MGPLLHAQKLGRCSSWGRWLGGLSGPHDFSVSPSLLRTNWDLGLGGFGTKGLWPQGLTIKSHSLYLHGFLGNPFCVATVIHVTKMSEGWDDEISNGSVPIHQIHH